MTCAAYDASYVAGKDDAHAELRAWQLGDHAATCGCELCQTVRAIVEHVLLVAKTPVLLPDHHIEGCAKPCGESCRCWCHVPSHRTNTSCRPSV